MKPSLPRKLRCAVRTMRLALPVTLWMLATPLAVQSQTDPLQIHQTQLAAIQIHQQIQQEEERWATQKAGMRDRLRSLQSEEKTLRKSLATIEYQLSMLLDQQAETERRTVETARIRDLLESHLDDIVSRLADHIEMDLPFLIEERSNRIGAVRTALVQPDINMAEKCRRVMEALKVETEYGSTVEVYQQVIHHSDAADTPPIMADILRVGRLALFWRTPDGKSVGCWDRAGQQWVPLPGRYRRHINDATEMALKRRTVEMVKLPLGRIARQ